MKKRDSIFNKLLNLFNTNKNNTEEIHAQWEEKVRERTLKTIEAKKNWERKRMEASLQSAKKTGAKKENETVKEAEPSINTESNKQFEAPKGIQSKEILKEEEVSEEK